MPHPRIALLPLLILAVAATVVLLADTSPEGPDDPAPPGERDVASLGSGDIPAPFQALGRDTGTTAIVLTKTRLELIDLDTAERGTFLLEDNIRRDSVNIGRRLLVVDHRLLVPNGLEVWSIDLGDGTVRDIGSGERVAPSTTTGTAWVLNLESATWREVDAAGGVIRTIDWPDAGIHWDHGLGTPEYASTAAGGIFRLEDDTAWSFVSDGHALAGNETTALVQTCLSLTACDYRWIDMRSGAEITAWMPPTLQSPGLRNYRLSPGGQSILEMNPTNRTYEAVYAYRDGVVRGTACHQGWQYAVWSPDETLVACITNKGVAVSDIRNGPAAIFEDFADPPLAIVLVDTASVGLLD
jgi:hypothetical protein